jgi:catechol 2,3-dioxygenase-like lactoylglutathione lyase family enzyme
MIDWIRRARKARAGDSYAQGAGDSYAQGFDQCAQTGRHVLPAGVVEIQPVFGRTISRKLAFFADPSGNLIELAEIVP